MPDELEDEDDEPLDIVGEYIPVIHIVGEYAPVIDVVGEYQSDPE